MVFVPITTPSKQLDDGWPESEKKRFSKSSDNGSRKKHSLWMVGELYMSYGGISGEKQDWLRRGCMWQPMHMHCAAW